MISGSGRTASVLKYNSSNLDSKPEEMESMLYVRSSHACSLFKSKLNEGRPILLAASGFGPGEKTAEILDFTKEGSSWQESNLTFASILSVYYVFKRD